MSFLNPLLLLGLLGASVPIIIHLIHKRRPREQKFAAIELLLRSVERVERRWRVKRFLLLATRVLLLAALAIAAAGPLLGEEQALGIKKSGPERIAIVIDGSLSMRARYDDVTVFKRALTAARNIVDQMGSEDMGLIVMSGQPPKVAPERPSGSKAELLRTIEALQPGYGSESLLEAIRAGAQALGTTASAGQQATVVRGRVIVLSDLTEVAMTGPAELAVPGSNTLAALDVIDLLEDVEPEARKNRAVTGLEWQNVPATKPRTVEFRARVQAFGIGAKSEPEPADIDLRRHAETLVRASIDVVKGTIATKKLRHAFAEPGRAAVAVHLEADALREDDVRYASIEVRRQVRTLIVDGAPSGLAKKDEIFYLERAFAAGAGDQPTPRVVTADDLTRTDLSGFDVIILAGVPSVGRSDGERLIEFVQKGGGLFITASEDLDVEMYNAALAPVLPRPLRGLKVVDADSAGSGDVVTMDNLNVDHPILELFTGEASSGLKSARTASYLLLEPGRGQPMETLVEFSDGQPALVLCEPGGGRVALLTTSIDRDLTDLPIRPAFVPLLRQLVLHLGDALTTADVRTTKIGEARIVQVPDGASSLKITDPQGREVSYAAYQLTGDSLRYEGAVVPGRYVVEAAFAGSLQPFPAENFVVNVDTKESDLRAIPVDEARAILLGVGEDPKAIASVKGRFRSRLSPDTIVAVLLFLMVLSFLLEGLLTAQRIGR